MYHELTPNSSTITVELRGMDLYTTDEDWRWCLIAVDGPATPDTATFGAREPIHLPLIRAKRKSICSSWRRRPALALTWTRVYNTKPYDKDIVTCGIPTKCDRRGDASHGRGEQIAYGVDNGQGATRILTAASGWVDNTATVASTAYIGPNARVLGTAKSRATPASRTTPWSRHATSRTTPVVSGYAVVYRTKRWCTERPRPRTRHRATGPGTLAGNAVVEEYAQIPTDTDMTIRRSCAATPIPFRRVHDLRHGHPRLRLLL